MSVLGKQPYADKVIDELGSKLWNLQRYVNDEDNAYHEDINLMTENIETTDWIYEVYGGPNCCQTTMILDEHVTMEGYYVTTEHYNVLFAFPVPRKSDNMVIVSIDWNNRSYDIIHENLTVQEFRDIVYHGKCLIRGISTLNYIGTSEVDPDDASHLIYTVKNPGIYTINCTKLGTGIASMTIQGLTMLLVCAMNWSGVSGSIDGLENTPYNAFITFLNTTGGHTFYLYIDQNLVGYIQPTEEI